MKTLSNHNCSKCDFYGTFQNGTPGCAKFKIEINPTEDYCSWFKASSTRCSLCGQPSDALTLYNVDNEWYTFCPSCYQHIHTCNTCGRGQECSFRGDTSEPPIVTQTVRQGNMVMQTQIKNPNLVTKHCMTCRCSYLEGTEPNCLKEINLGSGCPNWQLQKTLLQ